MQNDPINPNHYKDLGAKCECGKIIECIDITENFNFTVGNAIKYLWRADYKQNKLQDLKKAAWYINREIKKLESTFKEKE